MNSDPRLTQLHEWIRDILGKVDYSLIPVSGDASFRRYFRFTSKQQQFIAVDAPPDKENNASFINITHLLEAEGLPVPHIYFSTLDFGFFLLSDLGDTIFLDILENNNADSLYSKALNALAVIQQTSANSLPDYDQSLLLTEMELFRNWFLNSHLKIELSNQENKFFDQVFTFLIKNALQQPQVFVHRDYHSRNLMKIDNMYPGIIDYQDAVRGPVTYDLVSLLRDCYIDWPISDVEKWALSYRKNIINKDIIKNVDEETFLRWFDLMGIQRHLKAIGIFSRLNIRDKKSNYLEDIPRALNYIKTIAPKYPETCSLAEFVHNKVSI